MNLNELSEFSPDYYFDLKDFPYPDIFRSRRFVWEILPDIKSLILKLTDKWSEDLNRPGVIFKGSRILIGEGTVIEEGAYIAEPTIIGRNCVIRHGAYLRGGVIMGDHALVGHASEVKNSIFLNGAKAPHFNYVGDSILGVKVNLGAGTKLSNVKIMDAPVTVRFGDDVVETGLRKFGAIIGDRSQTGCNSVLNPGCLLGSDCLVYPNVTATGWYPKNSIVKHAQAPRVIARR